MTTSTLSDPMHLTSAAVRIDVVRVNTAEELAAVLEIRRRVFVEEQRAPGLHVTDADDARSVIALATTSGDGQRYAVATGRLTLPTSRASQGVIAWVAALPDMRGQGAGTGVMRFLLDAADDTGTAEVVLAAQVHAEPFYRQLGFVPAGPLYDVRGMAHRRMVRPRPLI